MINIKSDSRKIKEGDIFVALKGISSNGDDYVSKAIENGASTIITESDNVCCTWKMEVKLDEGLAYPENSKDEIIVVGKYLTYSKNTNI